MSVLRPYNIIISEETFKRIKEYQDAIAIGQEIAGQRLQKILNNTFGRELSSAEFIECLLSTKQPRIFAESEIVCDGSDWTHKELSLLGDINVSMEAQIYDNGVWNPRDPSFIEYGMDSPLEGNLLFTPGALLGTGPNFNGISPDLEEIIDEQGAIDQDKYNSLVERRMLPLFADVNCKAEAEDVPALVVLPGIGCGAFAGQYRGQMGSFLQKALENILQNHGQNFDYIDCVYYDPFGECANDTKDIHGISFRTRPAIHNPGKPQLSEPQVFAEPGEDFSYMRLYKIVAWDHVSLPGNDFFGNSRFTDDGVSAAASNSMKVLTGVNGQYIHGAYRPPKGFDSWEDVAERAVAYLKVTPDNIKIVSTKMTHKNLSLRALETETKPARSYNLNAPQL